MGLFGAGIWHDRSETRRADGQGIIDVLGAIVGLTLLSPMLA